MDGLWEPTNAVSNGTIPDHLPPSRLAVYNLPFLSQEQVRLRTSNLAGIFTGPIRIKPIKNWIKWSVRVSREWQGLPKFFGYPYYLRNG